ncbi:hypothetical protein IWW34DRAFT_840263 [Fusarium oxysporum f. sp. albedinis]|nr:hypothetical protein IWW34DRAFT_840263 [Fusarium oxysporum f. sp. albedinis]
MPFHTLLLAGIMAMIGHAKKPTKNLNSIYFHGNFTTISGGTGNKFGHNTGLTITDSARKEPYSEPYSGGASPCANPNMELKINIAISQTDVCGGGSPTGGECDEVATFSIASHTIEVRIRERTGKSMALATRAKTVDNLESERV